MGEQRCAAGCVGGNRSANQLPGPVSLSAASRALTCGLGQVLFCFVSVFLIEKGKEQGGTFCMQMGPLPEQPVKM